MTTILDVINDGLNNDDYLDELLSHLSNEHDDKDIVNDELQKQFESKLYNQ